MKDEMKVIHSKITKKGEKYLIQVYLRGKNHSCNIAAFDTVHIADDLASNLQDIDELKSHFHELIKAEMDKEKEIEIAYA